MNTCQFTDAVKFVKVDNGSDVILAAVIILLFLISGIVIWRNVENSIRHDDDARIAIQAIICVVMLIVLVVCAWVMSRGLTRYFAPEGYLILKQGLLNK